MCNEFGETIAIISTSEGEELPLEQALEIYHTALENSLAVDGLQLLWGLTFNKNEIYPAVAETMTPVIVLMLTEH